MARDHRWSSSRRCKYFFSKHVTNQMACSYFRLWPALKLWFAIISDSNPLFMEGKCHAKPIFQIFRALILKTNLRKVCRRTAVPTQMFFRLKFFRKIFGVFKNGGKWVAFKTIRFRVFVKLKTQSMTSALLNFLENKSLIEGENVFKSISSNEII